MQALLDQFREANGARDWRASYDYEAKQRVGQLIGKAQQGWGFEYLRNG
jgi:hypothetical protein